MSGHHHHHHHPSWVHRLTSAVVHRGRLCVGIDPHPGLLEAWGLPVSAEGLETFAEICVEAFVGEVAVVKPQVAFFEAYGAMCGDGGVAFLDEILNGKRLFGKREDPEFRACAAMALGRVNTKRSRESLQTAAGEKDVVVRNAVSRAIRGGGPPSAGRTSSA